MARWTFAPLTPDTWDDFEALFAPARGVCGGCWCMFWRMPGSEWGDGMGAGNRRALNSLVARGEPTGILAYLDGAPVGWCSLGPRAGLARMARSRRAKAPDSEGPVWTIVCFYLARAARGRGLMTRLVREAVRYARANGARLLEAYPLDPKPGWEARWSDGYMGLWPAFRANGFAEAARRRGRLSDSIVARKRLNPASGTPRGSPRRPRGGPARRSGARTPRGRPSRPRA